MNKSDYKYIIILTPGRTGSTLLMSILNTSLDNNSIYGEFKISPLIILNDLFESLDNYKNSLNNLFKNSTINKNMTHPYYKSSNLLNRDWFDENLKYIDVLKNNILFNFFKPKDKISGYKQLLDGENVENDINILKNILKNSNNIYFLINTRDTTELYNSYKRKTEFNRKLKFDIDKSFEELNIFYERNKDRVFKIDYSEFIDVNNENLKKMFDFFKLNFNKEQIKNTLKIKHSY